MSKQSIKAYPSTYKFVSFSEIGTRPMEMNPNFTVPVFRITLVSEFNVKVSLEITAASITNREILDHLKAGNNEFEISIALLG